MRKFLTAVILIPLGLVLVVFAVANHHFVTVSFDPFDSTDPALSLSLPLFVLIIAVAIMGVLAGGCATWFGQRHWRRAARRFEADTQAARAELASLRAGSGVARSEGLRLPGPAQTPYASSGRDKHRAPM